MFDKKIFHTNETLERLPISKTHLTRREFAKHIVPIDVFTYRATHPSEPRVSWVGGGGDAVSPRNLQPGGVWCLEAVSDYGLHCHRSGLGEVYLQGI